MLDVYLILNMKKTKALLYALALAGCASMVRDPSERLPSPYGEAEVVWKGRTVSAAKGVLVLKFHEEVPPERRDYLYRMLQLRAARSTYLPNEEAVQVIFLESWQAALDDLLRRPEIDWVHPDLPTDQL